MVNCYSYRGSKIIKDKCPDLYEKPFKGFVPKGNLSAGMFVKQYFAIDLFAQYVFLMLSEVISY